MSDNKYALPEGLPMPVPSSEGLFTEFLEGSKEHKIVIQRCGDCGTWQHGPEVLCHNCHSYNMTYEAVPPKGTLYSWQRCHYPVHPALADALPYLLVLVEVEGCDGKARLIGNFIGDQMEEMKIGAPMEAVFEDHNEGEAPYTLIQWKYA